VTTNGSADLHRVKSVGAPPSPRSEDPEKFVSLNHAMTAPSFSPDLKLENLLSPQLASPTTPLSPGPLSPTTQSKKEKAKEEKARKAAKKEEEKADKQKVKDYETRMKEHQKKQDAELKAALDASKASKAEDEKRTTAEIPSKENAPPSSPALGGLDRFVRSKSIRFSSLGKKERPLSSVFHDDTNTGPSTEALITEKEEDRKEEKEEKKKKSRFSIRKKSFGMLSDK